MFSRSSPGYMLGADVAVKLSDVEKRDVFEPGWQQREAAKKKEAQERAVREKVTDVVQTATTARVVGMVIGAGGGALLWSAHRFLGLLIGGVAGTVAGSVVAAAIVVRKAAESK